MQALAIIPARYDSVRFPGKLLANDTGKPLIQHTFEQACQAASLSDVIIATDDARIEHAVQTFGGRVVRSQRPHANGTSRIAEAIELLDENEYNDSSSIIVNMQGDEPEIEPRLIDLAVATLTQHADCQVGTIAAPFENEQESENPNVVKVVCNAAGKALYFSRAAIPFHRNQEHKSARLKHVGLYVYRRSFLQVYESLQPSPLETAESLEQLRFLERGYSIAVGVASADLHSNGIDTPEQYEAFVERYRKTQAS